MFPSFFSPICHVSLCAYVLAFPKDIVIVHSVFPSIFEFVLPSSSELYLFTGRWIYHLCPFEFGCLIGLASGFDHCLPQYPVSLTEINLLLSVSSSGSICVFIQNEMSVAYVNIFKTL